ncbi:MAG: YraN family protein [Sulfurimonas sp.]|jgi:Holliday junction resolvase-like predicted endonuclease
MTDQELKELVAQTFKGIQELRVSQAETNEQMKRTDEKFEELRISNKTMGKLLGNISNNQGEVAEEFFYNSLDHTKMLAGIHYDFVDKNWKNRVGAIEDEFDIVMVNGKEIAIIEVKYKAHESDLEKLLTKKYENFRTLFPMYKDYNHHLVLATFSLYDDLKEKALANGVTVLQRKGDTIESFVPTAA